MIEETTDEIIAQIIARTIAETTDHKQTTATKTVAAAKEANMAALKDEIAKATVAASRNSDRNDRRGSGEGRSFGRDDRRDDRRDNRSDNRPDNRRDDRPQADNRNENRGSSERGKYGRFEGRDSNSNRGGSRNSDRNDRRGSEGRPFDRNNSDRNEGRRTGKKPFSKGQKDGAKNPEGGYYKQGGDNFKKSDKKFFKKDNDRSSSSTDDRSSNDRKDRKPFGGKDKRPFKPTQNRPDYSQFKRTGSFRNKGYSNKKLQQFKNMNSDPDSTRLNRYIAQAGICSRREADQLIEAGLVSVNGEVITEMGFKVKTGDKVKYNNENLRAEPMVYVLLNKPKDFITTLDDPQGRRTVMELVSAVGNERIYPVGRLDRNTTGLLLMTNDGALAEKLTHPSFKIEKIYEVGLDKPITKSDFAAIEAGPELDDGHAVVDDLQYTSADKKMLGIKIHIGRNRIVRRMFEHFGYTVTKLDRVVYAGLTKKNLSRGQWRYLTEKEVIQLRHFQ